MSTSRTVGTDLLLGDTEKLIEQLKKRRHEKKEQLKTKYLANLSSRNADNNLSTSASASSSSSSNNLNQSVNAEPNQNYTTQASISTTANNNKLINFGNDEILLLPADCSKVNRSWTIPSDPNDLRESEDYLISARATVNSDFSIITNAPFSDCSCNEGDCDNTEQQALVIRILFSSRCYAFFLIIRVLGILRK